MFISGCATPQVGQPEVTKTIAQPFDRVWAGTVAAVSGDYPLQVIEKVSGVLETQMVGLGNAAKDYAFPPSVFLGVWGETRGRLSLYLKSAGETNTIVRIKGHFEGFEFNVTHNWHVWPSKGVLEQTIMEKIESNARAEANR